MSKYADLKVRLGMVETNPSPRTTAITSADRAVMRGNMTQVHEEFTCLEVDFCVLVAQLILGHRRLPFDGVVCSGRCVQQFTAVSSFFNTFYTNPRLLCVTNDSVV